MKTEELLRRSSAYGYNVSHKSKSLIVREIDNNQ